MMHSQKRVAIIGAGLSGLVCGYELQKSGYQVIVYEKEQFVGGRTYTDRSSGLRFDTGAQLLSNTYARAHDIGRALGIEQNMIPLFRTGHHILYDNHLVDVSFHSTKDFFLLDHLPKRVQLRLVLFFLLHQVLTSDCSFYELFPDNTEEAMESSYEYVVRWAGVEVADLVVDTFINAYHFHHAKELGRGPFLGILNVFGSNFSFEFNVEGMDALAKKLAEKLHVALGTPALEIQNTGEGAILTTAQGKRVFDILVISACPQLIKMHFLNPTERQQHLFSSVSYASTITVGLRVPANPVHHLAMVGVPRVENPIISSYMPQTPKAVFDETTGETVMTIFTTDAAAKTLMPLSDKEIYAHVIPQFIRACPPMEPYKDQISPLGLKRWPCAMPKYSDQSVIDVDAFLNDGQGEGGVYFCGDYMNAPWIEGAVRSGMNTARRIMSPHTNLV